MRQVVILAVAAGILAAAVLINKGLASLKETPERKGGEANSRTVPVATIVPAAPLKPVWVAGILTAADRIEVFAEVGGVLQATAKPFKVGQRFERGEVMLALDGAESLLALQAQRSAFKTTLLQCLPDVEIDFENELPAWKNYVNQLSPESSLPPLPAASASLNAFLSGRSVYQQFYSIKSAETKQQKFSVVAPFSGVVSQGFLSAGNLVRAQQKLGEFISTESLELEAAVNAEDAALLSIGAPAVLRSESAQFMATVARIGRNIDPSTQQRLVYLTVNSPDAVAGMYLNGVIELPAQAGASAINRNLLLGDSAVFVVVDSVLQRKAVSVVHRFEQTAYVTGLDSGDLLLNQLFEGAHAGMRVSPATN